jgi:hypothetical protein
MIKHMKDRREQQSDNLSLIRKSEKRTEAPFCALLAFTYVLPCVNLFHFLYTSLSFISNPKGYPKLSPC